jgi:hypothetical protein
MSSLDDDIGIRRGAYNQTGSSDGSVSGTRDARDELKSRFGDQFSAKLAAEYQRMTPEQRALMDGMTANEAKKEIKEAGKNREKLEATMRETEPSWKTEPAPKQPESRKLRTEDVIDTGRGDVLVQPRDREPKKKPLDPELPDGAGLPVGGVWRTFSTCDSGTITVWCQS